MYYFDAVKFWPDGFLRYFMIFKTELGVVHACFISRLVLQYLYRTRFPTEIISSMDILLYSKI